ncbi:hypothetical protein, partial [Agreia sp.]|uniref:hypothetical protein n=1 Tax=Agreia sp. TaxID=1872416 RepID=UPI0035BC1B3D
LYASPKAPGAKSVSQRVEEAHGEVALRDSVFARHQEVFSRHLALWSLYVFVRPDLGAEPRSRLSHVAALRFGLKDEMRTGHKQLALEF